MVIAGDFNAHLGTLAGSRGTGPPNQRGFIVKDLIDRNNLFVASHSHSSTGPPFTYHSGGTLSTIDYIIINRTASDILCSCEGLCDHSSNVSDHLPLSITLQVSYSPIENLSSAARINWERAITTDSIHARAVSDYITPLLDSSSDDISQLDYEICGVCEATCRIASITLPHFSNSKKKACDFYNNKELKHLCKASKFSWLDWKNPGRPLSGHLHEKRNSDKKRVRARLNLLRARQDRMNSEHIDKNFRDKAKRRFRTPQSGTPHGTRLSINGTITLNQSDVISAWATHFEELGASKVNGSSSLQLLQSMISSYKVSSSQNEDFIVDTPITVEEIEAAIAKLKRGKSCGPDGIFPEHILFGGSAYKLWLVKIFNEIIDFESIPRSFLNSIIVPIYKGKGRDPLLAKNYRGISLTSVIGKLSERILLQRLIPVLEDLGIPHYTQTAYQAGISCADPTEVVQEAVRSHL